MMPGLRLLPSPSSKSSAAGRIEKILELGRRFHWMKFKLPLLAIAMLLATGGLSIVQGQQDESAEAELKSADPAGKDLFTSRCAACHGMDGHGSEKAPSITSSAKVRNLDDVRLAAIISGGIPGTGMPAFRSFSTLQVHAVVDYLHMLQGVVKARSLPGDPLLGKKTFFGKGECSTCHTISGDGGFLGPELSSYGSALPSKAILDAILNPPRRARFGYAPAVATARDGARVEGLVRNEDNFSVQLQTKDGTFHLLEKSDLHNFEYLNSSIMPANYSERLSPADLNDLTSYLMNAE
jgi:cytochrome c oxidase cbb3-type subunit 3